MKRNDIIPNDTLIDDLTSNDYHTRWFAAEVIGTKSDLSAEQIKTISSIARTSDVGEVLIWGLGMMRAENVEELIGEFLEHDNNYFRWRAAEALRDIGSAEAVRILIDYLQRSNDSETRWKCAWALGEIGDISSFEELWRSAEFDDDRYVRWKAVWGITRLSGGVENLVKEKLDQQLSDYMIWRSAWILSRVGSVSTMEYLLSLKDRFKKSKYLKYQIALAIDTIKLRMK